MTVEEIYTKCKAWMFEKPSSTIYNDYIIPIINKVLAETYEENNMLRMFKYCEGDDTKLPFVDGIMAHQVSSMNDEVDYEDEYVLDVIPKGIDSYFLMDDDLNKMSILQVEYNNARVAHQCIVSSDTVNELIKKAKDAI
ncbi:MAG: hypothetical protein KBT03_06900 [Bacteroidales bacterium]|nr:hypothetical protein [Candidatus Scybalousia scybalohippi]